MPLQCLGAWSGSPPHSSTTETAHHSPSWASWRVLEDVEFVSFSFSYTKVRCYRWSFHTPANRQLCQFIHPVYGGHLPEEGGNHPLEMLSSDGHH